MVRNPYSLLRAKHLKELAGLIGSADPEDKEVFGEIIATAIIYGIERDAIADLSMAERSSVSRWATKEVSPRPLNRKIILERLRDHIHKVASTLET